MRTTFIRLIVASLTIGSVPLAAHAQGTAAAGTTLAAVKARGELVCGVLPSAPGFSNLDSRGVFHGLDDDTCHAVAAATLGDAAKVTFRPISSATRFTALQSGELDVLIYASSWTLTRDASLGILFTGVNFYDFKTFMVRKSLHAKKPEDLSGASFCFSQGSDQERQLADWASRNNFQYRPISYDDQQTLRAAFQSGRCDVVFNGASSLASMRAGFEHPDDYEILPGAIDKDILGPSVRKGDDQWFAIVRWTLFAMIAAEEMGVTQANVDDMLKSPVPGIRRLLGQDGVLGPALGLDPRWAYNIIKQVGNYGEVFERNVGAGSPLKLPRGANDLYTHGGLMISMAVQ